jgi:hypothetical protein
MTTQPFNGRSGIALLTALSLFVSPMVPLLPAQTTAPAAKTAPAVNEVKPEVDGGWPRTYEMSSARNLTIYEPQVASWDRQKHVVAYAAVAYSTSASNKPDLGSIKLEADTSVSLEERLVRFSTIDLTEVHFPKLSREQTGEITRFVREALPDDERIIALDRMMAAVETSDILPHDVPGIKSDPPKIFYSSTPAILVNLDGEAIWSPIQDNDLRFAVNTNWDLFEHGPTKTFYLRDEASWLQATNIAGPWTPAGKLPDSFSKLPAGDANWKEVKAALPGNKLDAKKAPQVFVSQEPAELILLEGKPKYEKVEGTSLVWLSNTESDVFRAGTNGTIYYLVAGRWFAANDFTGPWTFATLSLPPDFQKIPLEHERSRVLASVPGTRQAAEGILIAQIPETARVNIKTLKAPEVSYQGEPKFEPEKGAPPVESAVNTDKDIFLIRGVYYMCYNGVWFSAKGPNGPWEVETNVPKEIYQIPASSSNHHVTYVTVEDDDDDDDWATFAVVAGYTGMMIAWGCAVWGTGWYYPPYVWYGGMYPAYYPRWGTYGYSAWYNPYTGAYGRGVRAYGPYGGAGAGARYNPRTGTYSRGASAWGPYGSRGVAEAWNPRTGTYGRTRQGSNVYGSWGATGIQRGDDWAATARYTNRATGSTTRVTRTDEGAMASRRGAGGGTVAVGSGGDVYAGRDGNVYRREGGSWQTYDNGNWNNVDTPQQRSSSSTTRSMDSTTRSQLQRDSATRAEGSTRTRDYSSYRSSSSGSSGSRSAGSYRGGGARRGGGGRRR